MMQDGNLGGYVVLLEPEVPSPGGSSNSPVHPPSEFDDAKDLGPSTRDIVIASLLPCLSHAESPANSFSVITDT